MKQAEFQKKILEILERIEKRLANIENYLKLEEELYDEDYIDYEDINEEEKSSKKQNIYPKGYFKTNINQNN